MTRPRKIPALARFEPWTFRSRGGRLTTRPTRRFGGGGGGEGKGRKRFAPRKSAHGMLNAMSAKLRLSMLSLLLLLILYYHYCYHYLSISVTEIHVALCCHTKQARSKRLHTECCCSALTALLALWGFSRVESYQ